MEITLLPNGEYRLASMGKEALLSFPLPTCIHLREPDAKPSRLIGKLILLNDEITYRVEGEDAVIETPFLRVEVGKDLRLKAFFNGETVLEEAPFLPKEEEKGGMSLKSSRPV